MTHIKLFFSILCLLNLALWGRSEGAAGLRSQFLVNGNEDGYMVAGIPAQWSLTYFTENDTPHLNYMKMHHKLMHMIVVRDDLSQFAHIHPYFNTESGAFSMMVNEASDDPDNFAMSQVVPVPGRYYVFTESMPMPINDQMPMLMDRFEIRADGSEDVVLSKGQIGPDWPLKYPNVTLTLKEQEVPAGVRYFKENGSDGREGDFYQVIFSYINQEYCGRWLPKFFFKVSVRSASGAYDPVEDFEKWLNMGGHSLMISQKGNTLSEKKFFHLHAFLPMAEPGKFTFPYDHHRPPLEEGVYKIWGQFKRSSQVFTFPFVFHYLTPDLPGSPKC